MTPEEIVSTVEQTRSALPIEEMQQTVGRLDAALSLLVAAGEGGSADTLAQLGIFEAVEAQETAKRVVESLQQADVNLCMYLGDLGVAAAGGLQGAEPAEAADMQPPRPPRPDNTNPSLVTRVRNPKQQAINRRAAAKRSAFFEHAGHLHDETGVNTERVASFIAALGLEQAPYIITTDVRGVNEALEHANALLRIQEGRDGCRNRGVFLSDTGLAVVNDENPLTKEFTLIHESGGHGSAGASKGLSMGVLKDAAQAYITHKRASMHTMTKLMGPFLEEGFSTWLTVTYQQACGHQSSQGSPGILQFTPQKYRPMAYETYVSAAAAIDVLSVADPEIPKLLFKCRSQPGLVKEIKRRVDAIYPGLFGYLKAVPCNLNLGYNYNENTGHFKRGLGILLGAMGKGWHDLPELCDNSPAQRYAEQKLREYTQKNRVLIQAG